LQHSLKSQRKCENRLQRIFKPALKRSLLHSLIAFIHLSLGREIICGIHLKVLTHAARPEKRERGKINLSLSFRFTSQELVK
jgi:hypothetical protein